MNQARNGRLDLISLACATREGTAPCRGGPFPCGPAAQAAGS
ncbi:hypothetical protein ABZ553_31655 [Streptomyces sparsogenes]